MYNEQLEKLIELALADGELTEKEKQILFKKAEAEGIDLDEFEMVLDARLFEKNKVSTTQPPVSAPKSDKFGDVKKCPACGAMITAFNSSCSDCGHEFRNIEANKSVQLLSKKLEEVVSHCEDKSYGHMVGSGYGDEESARKDDILSKQKEVIKNFPIPNTKDDILELLYFISPKTKVGIGSDKDASAWRNKFSEIINRAKVAFANDNKMLLEIGKLENQQKSSSFSVGISMFNELSKKVKIIIVVVVFYALYFGGTSIYHLVSHKQVAQPEETIEQTVEQPQQSLQLNDLKAQLTAEEARLKQMNKFQLGRSGNKKAQQISDETLVIEKLKNKIDSIEKLNK